MSDEELSAAYQHCRAIIRRAAKTFYLGSLFLPYQKRRAAWAIYAFCRTVDDLVDAPAPQAQIAEHLRWWRSALEQTYGGNVLTQPILQVWSDVLTRYPVPLQPALDLLDGMALDLDFKRYHFATFENLHHYCYCVAGTVGLLTAPILGYRHEDALACAVDLGIAMQLTNILRDIGEDAAQGRIYLPMEEMQRFGYSDEELQAGVMNDAFRKLIEFQIGRAETYYQRAQPGIAQLSPDAQLSINLSSTLYRHILSRIQRNNYDVFTQRAHVPLHSKVAAVPTQWLRLKFGSAEVVGTASQ